MRREVTFPPLHPVKAPPSSHNLNQQHFIALLERAMLDNNSWIEKAVWCFWSCFLKMTGGKGERHRREKRSRAQLPEPMEPAGAEALQEGSREGERCTLVMGFLRAAKQWRAEGTGSKGGPCPQAGLLGWMCQMQLGSGCGCACEARGTKPCLFSQHWGGRRKPRPR